MLLFYLFSAAYLLVAQPVDDPFDYPGAQEPLYDGYEITTQYVELEDGTRIATDVYLPSGGPVVDTYPTVFQFTAYNRAILIPRFGPLKWVGAKALGLGEGPVFDMAEIVPNMAFLLSHGYAMVVSDMRGTGASFGSQLPLMPQLGQDGKQMIDWIASQPWCDGNVGMMGPSYLGWVQYMTAANHPEALKCIMPEVFGFDVYTAAFRPGGILASRWIHSFDRVLQKLNRNWYDLGTNAVPSLPVIDEDGDGKLTDEWPKMDSSSQVLGAVPNYKDGIQRDSNFYYQASLEHLNNVLIREFATPQFKFRDASGPAGHEAIDFPSVSPAQYLPEMMESEIPVYHVAGWFDGFTKGAFQYYASMGIDYPGNLFVAPRFHIGAVPKYYRKEVGYEGNYKDHLGIEQLRFFDRYLKGIDNGFEDLPPVLLFVMNKGWKQAPNWPLPNEERQLLLFDESGRLGQTATSGIDEYRVDFTAHSDYGRQERNRWLMTTVGPGTVMRRTRLDEQCLWYQTEPLVEGKEVTGHPIVTIWLSSNQSEGDIFVYLEDVAPDGTATYVTEGQLRSAYRQLVDNDQIVEGRYDVKPDLPWHGYGEEHYLPESLGEEAVELKLDLLPTSWYFRPGHRIRVSIAGADAGNFELNPVLCPEGTVESCAETFYRIHRGEAFPSGIDLPVIGESGRR